AGPAAAVPRLAVPVAGGAGAGGLGLRLLHGGGPPHPRGARATRGGGGGGPPPCARTPPPPAPPARPPRGASSLPPHPPPPPPPPVPVDPTQLVELARAVIAADRFPDLATIDGDQPRVRPVSPVRTDHFTVYVANLRNYHKTAEIAANPKVELCYLSPGHDQVRITGVAEVVTDRPRLQEIWDANALLRQYLGTLDNPA